MTTSDEVHGGESHSVMPGAPVVEERLQDHEAHPLNTHPTDWFKIGFYFTLGLIAMLVLAWAARDVLEAVQSIILPFVLGSALALLLDPLVTRLERKARLPRAAAALIVYALWLVALGGIISVVVPTLVTQATELANNGPAYIKTVQGSVDDFLTKHQNVRVGSLRMPHDSGVILNQLSARASAVLQSSTDRIESFLIGSASTALQLVLSLFVTLFLLIDLKRLRARLIFLAPESWRTPMKLLGSDIGGVFSDYLRGLIIVCVLLGTCVTILMFILSLFHPALLHYAVLIGSVAGVLYAVPYVGSLTTALLVFTIGYVSGGAGFGGIAVLATFALTQTFDNLITPKVVGGGVGLHPVLSVFALLLGAALFGIWGMLLSVPVAASIQVILFRLIPKTTAPTPPEMLVAHGVPLDQAEALKIEVGADSVTAQRKEAEKQKA